jgi:hypothetical protein
MDSLAGSDAVSCPIGEVLVRNSGWSLGDSQQGAKALDLTTYNELKPASSHVILNANSSPV